MADASIIKQHDVVEVLRSFLQNPPQGTPDEVLRLLADSYCGPSDNLPTRLFYELVEHLATGISITDTKANILYVNSAFANLTGYSAAELLGANHSLLSYKKTPPEVYQDLWQSLVGGRKWHGRLLNKRKDGTPYLANLIVAPIFDDLGKIAYYCGIHRDETQLNELQSKVNNQKQLIETLVSQAPVVIALLDEGGRVVVENNAYKALNTDMGDFEAAEAILNVLLANTGDTFADLIRRRQTFQGAEIRMDIGAGREPRWFSCSGTWIEEFKLDADNYFEQEVHTGLLLVCNDITLRMRSFEQAKVSAMKALMAEHAMVQNMRETVTGAIYQLQGPLNMLTAVASMIERSGAPGMLDVIKHVQDQGKEALDCLQACIPTTTDEPEVTANINELVREVLDVSADRFLTEGILVTWRPTPVLPNVTVRANTLRTAIKHIVDNAMTAVNEPEATSRELHIVTELTEDNHVQVIVTDKGPGIDPAEKNKIFEPFYSGWLRAKGKGGMGLAVAQQAMVELNGSIDLQGDYDGGSRVSLTIPLSVQ